MIKVGGFEIARDMTACKLPDEVQAAFDAVYGKLIGCKYTPVLYCGQQVVSGRKYMIICKTTPAVRYPELAEELIKVIIYAPLSGSGEGCREISRETLIGSRVSCGSDAETIVSPYVEYSYIFEAEYAAHMSVYVPSKIHDEQLEHIYVIGGKVVELDYKNGLCLREAMGVEDISGHYEKYSKIKPFTAGGDEGGYVGVAKGNEEDKYNVILWHNERRSFSLYSPDGMSEAEIKDFILSLRIPN